MNETARIRSKVLDGRQPGPHLLITGGVHGDEFEPILAIRQLADAVDPARLRGKLTLVACVNESAFALGRRTGADGLDLARTCPGRADGSITERVAHGLAELIRSADYYIDLHTGGLVVELMPLVGYTLHAEARVLERQRTMARAFGLPIIWGTTPNLEGRSVSVARDAGVPAIYAEWGGGGRCDPRGVIAYVEGSLDVMAHLAMIERGPRKRETPLVVEDPRPASGHLQLGHPSPCDGLFEPRVRLGQHVVCGDPIGVVSELGANRTLSVTAANGGLVICLRTFPRVLAGDSLAVVLETNSAEAGSS